MGVLKKIPVLIILVVQLAYVLSLNVTDGESLKDIENTLCKEPNCVMKCCPLGKYFRRMDTKPRRICDHFDNYTRDFSVFAKDISSMNTTVKSLNYSVKYGIFEANETFKIKVMNAVGPFNVYFTENADLYLERPNAYHRWTVAQNDKYCWDYQIDSLKTEMKPGVWVLFAGIQQGQQGPTMTITTLLTTGMLTSCFFFVLVLIVYAVLPELRNLCGQILMAYVGSLLCAFLLLSVMQLKQQDKKICPGLTYTIYYFFMASFCWMHVMSYDIWWTFRGYAKARPIHRRGENFKFFMYCLYAFGLPLAMTILLAVLNTVNMKHVPWLVTPKVPDNGCFLTEGERFLYLYVPMLILILCNWMFYLLTAINVWRLSRGTAVLDSAAAGTPHAHRTQRRRFMVYLKLSAVMGLNWVLEVVSALSPRYTVWFLTDLFNMLIGLTIFLIFVCKKEILRKLKKRFLVYKAYWRSGQNSTPSESISSDCSSSQETQALHVCTNPSGPGYSMKLIKN